MPQERWLRRNRLSRRRFLPTQSKQGQYWRSPQVRNVTSWGPKSRRNKPGGVVCEKMRKRNTGVQRALNCDLNVVLCQHILFLHDRNRMLCASPLRAHVARRTGWGETTNRQDGGTDATLNVLRFEDSHSKMAQAPTPKAVQRSWASAHRQDDSLPLSNESKLSASCLWCWMCPLCVCCTALLM